jgi:hypothetical protein
VVLFGCGEDEAETCVPVVLQDRFDEDTIVPKGCYLALQTPIVAAGVQVTLEPGVQITFSQDTGLEFSADQTLHAVGTAELPILLTSEQPQRGFWSGLSFQATESDDNRLEYVTIEYGGSTAHDSNGAAVKATADSRGVHLGLAHTTIRQSQGWGLYLDGSAVVPVFADNTLTENTLGPASVDSDVAGYLDAGSNYTGNDSDEVMVRTNRVTRNATWAAIGVPYHLSDNLNVEVPWTIEAGNTLILAEDAWISINGDEGGLRAVGTAQAPILFTGEQQVPGFWQRLQFGGNNASNRLEFVTVEYGGSTAHDSDGAGVRAVGDSSGVTLSLSNTTVRHCQGWGLFLTGSAVTPVFAHNTFTQNGLGAASIGSEAVYQLDTSSTYTGNAVDLVQVRDHYISKTATWQDLGVPYNAERGLAVNGEETNPVVWTLAPGVTLILPEAAILSVAGDYSGFSARGTADNPIRITGAEQTKGFWKSIAFDTTLNGANAIEYAIIEYGGSVGGTGEQGMIQARADSHGVSVNVTNSTIQHSGLYGIWFGGSASGDIETGNTFADNDSGDIFRE